MHPIANPFYALSGLVQSMPAELATKYSFAATMYPLQSACSATPPSHILTFFNSDSPRPSSPDPSHDTRKTFYSLKNLPCFQPHKPPSHMTDYYTTFICNYATFTPISNNLTLSSTTFSIPKIIYYDLLITTFFLYTYYTSSRSTQWSHEHAGGSGSDSDDPDGLRLIPHAGGKINPWNSCGTICRIFSRLLLFTRGPNRTKLSPPCRPSSCVRWVPTPAWLPFSHHIPMCTTHTKRWFIPVQKTRRWIMSSRTTIKFLNVFRHACIPYLRAQVQWPCINYELRSIQNIHE